MGIKMKVRSNWIKSNKYIFLGFIVPLLVMVFTFMTMQITPFGTQSLIISDADGIYIDSLTAFRQLITEKKSLFYTWGQIQGSTPFSVLSLGMLVSTFNFLAFFVPQEAIPTLFSWLIILRIACAGATFAFYLKYTFRKNDIGISIFAWCYALMAYNIGYSYHIIWLDQVVMLPLVLWGVEKILKNKKDFIYFTVTLAISFLMNFYIAYMLGVFSFIYFVYRYLTSVKKQVVKDFFQKFVFFMLSPILAFGASSILLLPIMNMLMGRDGIMRSSEFSATLRYEFPELISKLFIGTYDSLLPGGTPFIYCGLATLLLVIYYFISYAISYKEKILSVLMMAFLFLSLTFNPFYLAWHGFENPTYFEGRFSFIISFYMLFIAYQGLNRLETISLKQGHIIFGILVGIILLFNREEYGYFSDAALLYTLVFLALYFALWLFLKKKNYYKAYRKVLFALLVGCEMITNARLLMMGLEAQIGIFPLAEDYTQSYQTHYDLTHNILAQDQDFYRIETSVPRSMNAGFGVGYPSISHFNTIYNFEQKEKMGALGLAYQHNSVQYMGTTLVTDFLLNIKYIYQKDLLMPYEELTTVGEYQIYKNPYALSMGFVTAEDLNHLEADNPILLQNKILNGILGREDKAYFESCTSKEVNKKYTESIERKGMENGQEVSYHYYYKTDDYQECSVGFEVESSRSGPLYCYFEGYTGEALDVSVNNQMLGTQFSLNNHVIYLGSYDEGEKVNVNFKLISENIGYKACHFYSLDEPSFKEAIKELSNKTLNVVSYSDQSLQGEFMTQTNDALLFTSIPYDEGWEISVDGKVIVPIRVLDTFLGIPIENAGKHEMTCFYLPKGYRTGLYVTMVSWLLIIGSVVCQKILKVTKNNNLNNKKCHIITKIHIE